MKTRGQRLKATQEAVDAILSESVHIGDRDEELRDELRSIAKSLEDLAERIRIVAEATVEE